MEFVIPVLKWLKNPEAVSDKALEANYVAILAVENDGTNVCLLAALYATAATYEGYIDSTEKWINEYFNGVALTRDEVEAKLFGKETSNEIQAKSFLMTLRLK